MIDLYQYYELKRINEIKILVLKYKRNNKKDTTPRKVQTLKTLVIF